MARQIAVRLPDELVEFVDSLVRRGVVTSRAAFIVRLLEREQRRDQALEDLEIIKRVGPDPELNTLAKWQLENLPEVDYRVRPTRQAEHDVPSSAPPETISAAFDLV